MSHFTADELRDLYQTLLYRVVCLLPFLTPALVRAACVADRSKPSNGRVVLRRLEAAGLVARRFLRLIIKPVTFVGKNCLCRIEQLSDCADTYSHICERIVPIQPASLLLGTVGVWHFLGDEHETEMNAECRIDCWKRISAEQSDVFDASVVGNETQNSGVITQLMRAESTCIQNLGFVLLRLMKENRVEFLEEWPSTAIPPWWIEFDRGSVPIGACVKDMSVNHHAFVRSVGAAELAKVHRQVGNTLEIW